MTTLFSRSELYALNLLYGGDWIVGMTPDALLPLGNATKLAELRSEGMTRLQRRDFIRLTQTADDSADVNASENLDLLCKALFQAERALVMSKAIPGQGTETMYYHRHGSTTVAHSILDDDTHAMRLLPEPAELFQHLAETLPAVDGAELHFESSEDAVASAVRLATAGDAAAAGKAMAPKTAAGNTAAEAFAASLTGLNYVAIVSLLEVNRSDGEASLSKLTCISTKTHNWLVLTDANKVAQVLAGTKAQWQDVLVTTAERFAAASQVA